MARERSAETWRREVEDWRASGASASKFASTRGYSSSSLLKWSSALRRDLTRITGPAFVRLEVASTPASTEIVLEIGRARVRVARGFDGALLREVVAALSATEAQ